MELNKKELSKLIEFYLSMTVDELKSLRKKVSDMGDLEKLEIVEQILREKETPYAIPTEETQQTTLGDEPSIVKNILENIESDTQTDVKLEDRIDKIASNRAHRRLKLKDTKYIWFHLVVIGFAIAFILYALAITLFDN